MSPAVVAPVAMGHIELVRPTIRRSLMIRVFYSSVALLALAGQAFAQGPPAANAPGAAQAPGRGAFAPVVIGPSAPVPPEVAIPRPAPEELAQVNDALTKWIASDKSSAKPLLQKY